MANVEVISNRPVIAEEPILAAPDLGRPGRNAGRLVQLFTNVNLNKGHDGLAMLCEQYGIDVVNLEPGQYVVFANRKRDKVKVFAANNVVAYLRLPQGHFLTLETLALIPMAFRGTADIEHDRGLRDVFQPVDIRPTGRQAVGAQQEARN